MPVQEAPLPDSAIARTPDPIDRDWIEVARELAREFESTVVERDRANQRPFLQLRKLRESGLVNLLIPRAFGGEGGSIREAAHVVLEILHRVMEGNAVLFKESVHLHAGMKPQRTAH